MTGDKKFLVSVFLLILLILTGSAQNRRSKREWMTEGCWIKKRGGGGNIFSKITRAVKWTLFFLSLRLHSVKVIMIQEAKS